MTKKNFVLISLTALVITANASAQNVTPSHVSLEDVKKKEGAKKTTADKQQKNQLRELLQKNPSCKNILNACESMGFVAGGFKEGNGLWKNCFHPLINNKPVTQKGQPVVVNVDANDIASCKNAAPKEKLKNDQKS